MSGTADLQPAAIAVVLRQVAHGLTGAMVTSGGLLIISGGSTWLMAGGWMIRVVADGTAITSITDARAPDGSHWQWMTPADASPLQHLTHEELELLWARLVLLDPPPASTYGSQQPSRPVRQRPVGSGIAYRPRR